jgi:hypothetical protein
MRFTPKSEEELKSMMLSNGGIYDFEVENATDEVSKNGNDMIVLKIQVFTTDGTAHFAKDWLVGSDAPLSLQKLQNFCKSTGMMQAYEDGTLDAMSCIGLCGKLKISVSESPQYGRQTKVADYVGNVSPVTQEKPRGPSQQQTRAANDALATAAGSDDEIPF